jgi:opacity protein-like surface antigen
MNMHMRSIGRLAPIAILATLGTANAWSEEWKNAVTPYIWASGMSGDVVIGTPQGPLESNVDLSFSDIVSNLDFGAMVSYRGGRDRWVVLGDYIFMNLGGAKTTNPLNATVRAGADMRQTMFEGDVGYHITDAISLFAGARYNDISGSISLDTTTILGTSSRTAKTSESWVDPVVGLLGEWPLTEHLQWDLRADIGGFNVGSKLAWQVMGVLRWKIRENMDVVASYRYMQVDFEDEGSSGLQTYDMVNTGPGIGMTFRF